jgi:hypothetical protein
MSGERSGYLAYLLRMWRVDEDGGSSWRASLERPGDGEQLVFATLEAAFDYLRERGKEESEGSPAPPDEDKGNGP